MEKSEILSRQAALVRLEAIEKSLKRLEEKNDGVLKRLKGLTPKAPKWQLVICSVVSLILGTLIGAII